MRCYSEEYFPTVILRSTATKNLVSLPGALERFFTSFRMTGEGGKILRSAQNDREEEKTSPLLSF